MPHATTHRVLFIDAYDSFTNNIIALLETSLHVQITTIKIDEPISNFANFLKPFSAVVAGPGPGDPRNSKDVGWIRELWQLDRQDVLPILGICLGFQSLVLAFGGTVDRLEEPRHGIVRRVRGLGEGIFRDVEDVETVQYHSLHASIGLERKSKWTGSYDPRTLSIKCSDLRPLAWDYEMDNTEERKEEAASPNLRRVLMAVEHRSKPFFGIQFHAESICSNENARKVIERWWDFAKKWRRPCRGTGSFLNPSRSLEAELETFHIDSKDENPLPKRQRVVNDPMTPSLPIDRSREGVNQIPNLREDLAVFRPDSHSSKCKVQVETRVMDVNDVTVPSMCETLGLTDGETIVLDSEMHKRHEVGEYSIIGIVSTNSVHLEYKVGTREVHRTQSGQCEVIDLPSYGGTILSYLKSFMGQYKVENPGTRVPFWGGLVGFISYETCLETIGITDPQPRTEKNRRRPDLSFVFVERSIVIDHSHQKIHIQSIKPDDQDWLDRTTSRLKSIKSTAPTSTTLSPPSFNPRMSLPDATSYQSKVRTCQSAIRAGDSYELCLTTQASIHTPTPLSAWPLYRRLRSLNPAPFSAYVRLGALTLLSSSPERFLRWSRPTNPNASSTHSADAFARQEKTIACQFRPIKGTVKRQPDPNLPPLTLAEATALLATPKERAENLMIVDLIRHDLHGVVGSGRVQVPKLMVVEEYATLFQLVSVVEGSLLVVEDGDGDGDGGGTTSPNNNDPLLSANNTANHPSPGTTIHGSAPARRKTGIDILAASLPPGSMTGAPKLRSCHILRELEQRPRGAYSGVLGYMDVGGGGDFSVVIRSAVRWDRGVCRTREASGGECGLDGDGDAGDEEPVDGEEEEEEEDEEWTIGAGGAVTSLSTEEGEWEEMLVKLKSTLRLFEGGGWCEGVRGNGEGEVEDVGGVGERVND